MPHSRAEENELKLEMAIRSSHLHMRTQRAAAPSPSRQMKATALSRYRDADSRDPSLRPAPHRYLTRISDKLEMNGVHGAVDAEEADSAEFLTFLHPPRTNHSPVK